jgi:hypothetical protein
MMKKYNRTMYSDFDVMWTFWQQDWQIYSYFLIISTETSLN